MFLYSKAIMKPGVYKPWIVNKIYEHVWLFHSINDFTIRDELREGELIIVLSTIESPLYDLILVATTRAVGWSIFDKGAIKLQLIL